MDCIFCNIVNKKLSSRLIYEDDELMAFHDLYPIAPVHFLIIPKKHISSLMDVCAEDNIVLGNMMVLGSKLSKDFGCHNGYRFIINCGVIGAQQVYHLHLHVLSAGSPMPIMAPIK